MDLGSGQMFVHKQCVSLAEVPVGVWAYIACIHGNTQPYPLAHLSLPTGRQEGCIRAVVACHLVYPMIVGQDWGFMTKLIQLMWRMDKTQVDPKLAEPELGEIFFFLDPEAFGLQPRSHRS